jgi:hypothetical protein
VSLLSSVEPLVTLVVVGVAATITQRKCGWKGVRVVWLASTTIWTGYWIAWFCLNSSLPARETLLGSLRLLALFFPTFAALFGLVVWIVSALVSPPKRGAVSEANYFPFNAPAGKREDTPGMTGILPRYQELLATFATALDEALASTPVNPYQSIPRAFLVSFRTWSPSFLRQAHAASKELAQAPNALARDLAGAAAVLAELDTLTPAQFAAIEECHRVNMKRLRERSIFRWSLQGKIAALIATLVSLAGVVEQVGGVKASHVLPLLKGVSLMGTDLQSSIIRTALGLLVAVLMFFVINFLTFLPILARVRAFEDILTIAKAYRKGLGEGVNPAVE